MKKPNKDKKSNPGESNLGELNLGESNPGELKLEELKREFKVLIGCYKRLFGIDHVIDQENEGC